MNHLICNRSSYFTTVIVTLVAMFALVACGGGGGDAGTQVPVSVTVACPNGTTQTATTTDIANALCSAPVMLSVTPSNLSANSSPDSLIDDGIVVITDSMLDITSLTTTNVMLKVGSLTNITGVVSVIDAKGFRFVPVAKLQYGQSYDFVADVKDTLGKTLTIRSSFTTSLITCISPQVPNSAGTICTVPPKACVSPAVWTVGVNACVYPVESQALGANQLPHGCNSWKDQCWRDAVTDGTVKWVTTSAIMTGYSNRPVVFAYFRNTAELFGVTGMWNYLPVYADDGSFVSQDISGGVAQEVDWVYGNTNGVIAHIKDGNTCVQQFWDVVRNVWQNMPIVCPVITCTALEVWNGTSCAVPTPTCTAPQVWDGTSCAAPTPTCTSPAVWDGVSCAAPNTSTCTAPALWNGTSCAIPVATCNFPAIWTGTVCIVP